VSRTLDNLKHDGRSGGWYLKKPDGSQFGPVTLEELVSWAEESRIVSGNQLSSDRKTWVSAETIPELKMVWQVELPDGKVYGPFNAQALLGMDEHGSLPQDAMLRHTGTQKDYTFDAFAAQVTGHAAELLEADARTSEPQPDGADRDDARAPHASKKATPGAAKSRRRSTQAPDSETGPTDAETHPPAGQDADTTPADAAGEQETARLRQELNAAKAAVTTHEQAVQKLEARCAELEKAVGEAAETSALEEQVANLQKEIEAERAEKRDFEAQREALRETEAKQSVNLKAAAEQVRAMKAELTAKQQELQSAHESFKEAQVVHRQEERTYLQGKREREKELQMLQAELGGAQRLLVSQRRFMLALGLGLVCAVALIFITDRSGNGGAVAAVDETDHTQAPLRVIDDTPEELDLDLSPTMPSQAVSSAPAVAWPDLEMKGVNVRREGRTCSIIFEEPVFSSLITPAPRAVEILGKLAVRLRDNSDRFMLVVEGHTDNVPPGPNARYKTNHALGAARAETIRDLLTGQFRVPRDATRAISLGDVRPPYPNDTAENRLKNRTIVLKLIPRTPPS
jgi:flagellar motor protein MotB